MFVCQLKFADKRQKKKRRENKAEEISKGGSILFFYTALYMTVFHVRESQQAGASAGNPCHPAASLLYMYEDVQNIDKPMGFFPFTL